MSNDATMPEANYAMVNAKGSPEWYIQWLDDVEMLGLKFATADMVDDSYELGKELAARIRTMPLGVQAEFNGIVFFPVYREEKSPRSNRVHRVGR